MAPPGLQPGHERSTPIAAAASETPPKRSKCSHSSSNDIVLRPVDDAFGEPHVLAIPAHSPEMRANDATLDDDGFGRTVHAFRTELEVGERSEHRMLPMFLPPEPSRPRSRSPSAPEEVGKSFDAR